jgi:hypothetical protein
MPTNASPDMHRGLIAVHASKSEHFCSCLCNRACVNVFWRAAGWRLRPHLRIRSRVGARAAAPPLRRL